ncbi:MAG: hypothetical protein IJT09_05550, partial [Abditibacteriota bacterium]|nr:hypothetical protein [Abditibacteriota bacterium]
ENAGRLLQRVVSTPEKTARECIFSGFRKRCDSFRTSANKGEIMKDKKIVWILLVLIACAGIGFFS